MKRIVIKVGTKVLTNEDGVISGSSLKRIVDQVLDLKSNGVEVVLVSSGAMGAGKNLLKTNKKLRYISEKQFFSAIGQTELIGKYSKLLAKEKIHCAQVLATKEDFRDKSHFFNMRNCLEVLLHDDVVPIVNENDVVALDELTFTDNDELAGLVASMLNADALFLLTSVDGLIDTESNKVIGEVRQGDYEKHSTFITADKSEAGRGGMATKFFVAKKLASQGIDVYIANGNKSDIVSKIVSGDKFGTYFPSGKKLSSTKRRIAHSDNLVKGKAHINDCATDIMKEKGKATSLLLVGVTKLEGNFKEGDVIEVIGLDGKKIGYGVSKYSTEDAKRSLGKKNTKPLIHYDYLYIE